MLASAAEDGKPVIGHVYDHSPSPTQSSQPKATLKVTFLADASIIPEQMNVSIPPPSLEKRFVPKPSPPNKLASKLDAKSVSSPYLSNLNSDHRNHAVVVFIRRSSVFGQSCVP